MSHRPSTCSQLLPKTRGHKSHSIATTNIANKPAQAIHLYFLIQFEINVAAKAINAIDNTNPKANNFHFF